MCGELDEILIQQKQLSERAAWLLDRVETYPTVQPVLVAYRYGREDRDDALADARDVDPLLAAYEQLLNEENQAQCSAVGVEVGGALFTMHDLRGRYPNARSYF